MLLDDYQKEATKTAVYDESNPIAYCLLGLTGEAGEVANKYKKVLRGDKELSNELRKEMAKELGDVMWYIAMTSKELGFTLDAIAQMNIAKLQSRRRNKTIKGDGDNR